MFRLFTARIALAACLTLTLAVLVSAQSRPPAQPATRPPTTSHSDVALAAKQSFAPAPKPDVIDDIIDVIIDIITGGGTIPPPPPPKGLSGWVQVIAEDDPPPLTSSNRSLLEAELEDIERWLADVESLLTPSGIGQPGSAPTFNSLLDCAEQCLDWANEALEEAESHDPSMSVIGNRIDSIKLALPQFRELADIH